MQSVKYVKSFSKGQITIPKEIRETLGIYNDFWLKLHLEDGKIVAEPVKKTNKDEYRAKLLSVKGGWFDIDEYNEMREQTEAKLKERGI